jgi:hypothetical protein
MNRRHAILLASIAINAALFGGLCAIFARKEERKPPRWQPMVERNAARFQQTYIIPQTTYRREETAHKPPPLNTRPIIASSSRMIESEPLPKYVPPRVVIESQPQPTYTTTENHRRPAAWNPY